MEVIAHYPDGSERVLGFVRTEESPSKGFRNPRVVYARGTSEDPLTYPEGEATVIFRPSAKLASRSPTITEYFGEEISFEKVPIVFESSQDSKQYARAQDVVAAIEASAKQSKKKDHDSSR
jgi:hypothetical protein